MAREEWDAQIAHAQTVDAYDIGGFPYARVRCGDESEDWGGG